jgi:uncharacterized radical SAM protein YgiQ
MPRLSKHLPVSTVEARERGWGQFDVIFVTGDPHVDHPAFPASLLGRVLEAAGFRVGVISRPDPDEPDQVGRLGVPRLFFGVTAGSLDSMVGNYTAQKRLRSDDPYSPDGKAGGRPDRALNVYCNMIRRTFGKSAFLVAGGLEASLRRFAHYDFWSDSVRRPILMDCGADVLVHGMGETPIVKIANRLERLLKENPALVEARQASRPVDPRLQTASISDLPGVVFRTAKSEPEPKDGIALPSTEELAKDPMVHAKAFRTQERNRGRVQWQNCAGMRVVANPAAEPLSQAELDRVYSLPYTLDPHPMYEGKRIPALEQVRYGVVSHRGCFGGCAFCAIGAHQGKTITSRSRDSILDEIKRIVNHPKFRGTITDVGGPTANMYGLACEKEGGCDRPSCLWPKVCRELRTEQRAYLRLLQAAEKVPGVKHLFVTTGIRTDLAVLSEELVRKLARHHTSGQMKVAPEHTSPEVLDRMRKTPVEGFVKFLEMHRRFSKEAGRKQFVLPYLMAAHPGCDMDQMAQVPRFLKEHGLKAEQCQIFTPTPGTAATVMYATGIDPGTLRPVFVERNFKRRQEQKEMILHHLPKTSKASAKKKRSVTAAPARRRS